jgi:hypothetical protein
MGFGGHRERKGWEEEGGAGCESEFLDLTFFFKTLFYLYLC